MTFQSNIALGYGKSHSSFGEILQGRMPDKTDFLVTLPINMWSICNLTSIKRRGPLVINCEFYKSAKVAEMLLSRLGITDNHEITISFSRNIPIGKGLSSSTADMLSTVRALQEIFGFLLREKTISEIFSAIEPHDGLMYKSCTIYNHRKGELVRELLYIPQFWIIAVDFGGEVSTVSYNESLYFEDAAMEAYKGLLVRLENAFQRHDDGEIAACATASTLMHIQKLHMVERMEVVKQCEPFNPIGVINTHSGTCLGLLYSRAKKVKEINALAKVIENKVNRKIFVTNTLKLLV